MLNIISIDWLTLWGEIGAGSEVPHYRYGGETGGGRIFSRARSIQYKGKEIAVVASDPCSGMLSPKSAQLTMRNWVLYDSDLNTHLFSICRLCGFRALSISRIDICMDFQCFACGLNPRDFIKGFWAERYIKNGGGNFSAFGKCRERLDVNTLTFGKRASGVYCRLYNKSVEQVEQVSKPWIREMWRAVGLDESKDVWRLEFELRGRAIKLCDKTTGEIEKLPFKLLFDKSFVVDLFSALCCDYFEFKIAGSDTNKSRLKSLRLFNFETSELMRVRAVDMSKGRVREKVMLKNLHLFMQRYFTESVTDIYNTREMAEYLAKVTGLEHWYYSHCEDWERQYNINSDN